jgi:hypothetical protein
MAYPAVPPETKHNRLHEERIAILETPLVLKVNPNKPGGVDAAVAISFAKGCGFLSVGGV